jgi:hypothetical protein
MTSQLLIEMPAEGAARLLTLSLLEQLSQRTPEPNANGDTSTARAHDTYRSALGRLRGCVALYADALGDSVPRKSRRALRSLGAATDRLHRTGVQLAWSRRMMPDVGERDALESLGDGARAAAWLHQRLGQRQERAARALQRVQADARPLRRLERRLGVYTTAVRLDTVSMQRSFAAMSGDQLTANALELDDAMRASRTVADHGELRRALQVTERLGYLIEPIRAYIDVDVLSADIGELRRTLERLDDAAIVGRAIVRAGRRVGALHAADVLRATMWSSEIVSSDHPENGRAHVTAARLQRGLIILAQMLHDDAARAFDDLEAMRLAGMIDRLDDGVTELATRLRQA